MLPALLVTLLAVLAAGAWVVAAQRGVAEFTAGMGDEATSVCDGDLTIEDVRPRIEAPANLAVGLDEVERAFARYFAQERWSYTTRSERFATKKPDEETTLTVDGQILERRGSEGFVGLIKPGAGIARFEGARFWVPACVNGNRGWQPWTNADCVESERSGGAVVTRWVSHREGTCDDAVVRWSATVRDGALVGWSIEGKDRFRTTATAEQPRSLSWPSPFWVAPSWMAR